MGRQPRIGPDVQAIRDFLSRHPLICGFKNNAIAHRREWVSFRTSWRRPAKGRYMGMSPARSVRYDFWIARTLEDGSWTEMNEQPVSSIASKAGFGYAISRLDNTLTTYPWKQWVEESHGLGRQIRVILYSIEREGP